MSNIGERRNDYGEYRKINSRYFKAFSRRNRYFGWAIVNELIKGVSKTPFLDMETLEEIVYKEKKL